MDSKKRSSLTIQKSSSNVIITLDSNHRIERSTSVTSNASQLKSGLMETYRMDSDGNSKDLSAASENSTICFDMHDLQYACGFFSEKSMMPDWDFTSESIGSPDFNVQIPLAEQEKVLIDDVLSVIIGRAARYIEPRSLPTAFEPVEFVISPMIDLSLVSLTEKILPLASHYSIVQRFCAGYSKMEMGRVNHALVDGFTEILKDYYAFVCQLETEYMDEKLTLQKMRYYVERNMEYFNVLKDLASKLGSERARGGRVLTLLHEFTQTCAMDERSQKTCILLTQKASIPYMQMLSAWIYTGTIKDPFKEFLIEENEKIHRSKKPFDYSNSYWTKLYNICADRVPVFLERYVDIILRTGKYLNVVRQCGKSLMIEKKPLVYDFKEPTYIEEIEDAYKTSGKLLHDVIMKEHDLIGRLSSIKHYFLLDQGDFTLQFMELGESELSKNVKDVSLSRLKSTFDLALRTSQANVDPYKDDIRVILCERSLTDQAKINYGTSDLRKNVTGWESFSFAYEAKWPISLILNTQTLMQYQLIFRHLFYCKHVERLLCKVWLSNKEAKSFDPKHAKEYLCAFALRQRMLNYVQNLEYHMMVEVIEPNWINMKHNISKANNMDEILKCQAEFLSNCLVDCMLKIDAKLFELVNHLLNICVTFCQFMQKAQRYFVDAELTSMINETSESFLNQSLEMSSLLQSSMNFSFTTESQRAEMSIKESENFAESIERLDFEFNENMLRLIRKIQDIECKSSSHNLTNLLHRLDFNSFYISWYRKYVDSTTSIGK